MKKCVKINDFFFGNTERCVTHITEQPQIKMGRDASQSVPIEKTKAYATT